MTRLPRFTAVALALLLGCSAVFAQSDLEQPNNPKPKAAAAEAARAAAAAAAAEQKRQPPSFVRVLFLPSDGTSGAVSLRAQTQGMDSPAEVAAIEPGQVALDAAYREFNAGDGAYELRAGDRLLASGTLRLLPSRGYTIVAWQGGQNWQTKVFADDLPPSGASDRAVRVLNFAAGRETLLSFDGTTEIRFPGNSVQEVKAPVKLTGVAIKTLAPDGGPPAQSVLEVDFREVPSLYVVVAPDNRGRMRSSMIESGAPLPMLADAAPPAPTVPQVPDATHQKGLARMELEHQLGQIMVQMNQPGEEGNRAALEAKKKEIEAKLKRGRTGG
jgi:hypothetical protein